MLPEFFREQMTLLWQPNLGRKTKLQELGHNFGPMQIPSEFVFRGYVLGPLAAQRKIKWLGTGAEIEAPKALRSETPKASRGVGNGEGVSPSPATRGSGEAS